MIEAFGRELWTVDGDRLRWMTIPFTTRMTVVRLASGDLWLHSPVAATEARVEAVSALGPVRHIVAPNKLHHVFLAPWLERFSEATSWAEPGLVPRRKDLRFDHALGDAAEPVWASDLDQVLFAGSSVLTEAVFFHRPSKTVVFTDLVQNHDPSGEGWFWRLGKGLNGILAPDGGAPRDWRLTVRDRESARASVRRILAWDFDRVVLSHGLCVDRDGHAFVERAFRWLQA